MPTLSGTVKDTANAAIARTVRVYNQATGALVGQTTSDSGSGIWSITTATTDAHFAVEHDGTSEVVLLLHMDDTGLSDALGKTITKVGNVARSGAQSKFGSYSAIFDGTGDYLSIPNSTDFDFGSAGGTIEMYVRPSALTGYHTLISKISGTYGPFAIYITPTKQLEVLCSTSGTAWEVFLLSSINLFATGNFYHVAVVINAGYVKGYVEGVEVVSGAISGALTSNSAIVMVGADPGGYGFNGYIDEVRVSKGKAQYTADFSGAVPSSPFNGMTQYGENALIYDNLTPA